MEKNTIRIRDTAKMVSVKSIIESNYYQQEGWQPNYILSGNEKIFRVNLTGIVISKALDQNNQGSVIVEDNSGQIMLRTFEGLANLTDVQIGEIIKVIGKPREFSGQKYILPEIIKKISIRWHQLRVLELKKIQKETLQFQKQPMNPSLQNDMDFMRDSQEPANASQTHFEKPKSKLDVVYDKIRELDEGQGADISRLIDELKDTDIDASIKELISQGDVFEIRQGKLKVLE